MRKELPKSPRLRRSSPVTRFGTLAALQAVPQGTREAIEAGKIRLGIIAAFMNGCVNYSNRFYSEVLADPNLASPLLFPETVFNAPASHFATLLNSRGPAYTLLGDSATWFSALQMADLWLTTDMVDSVLVISAEECDWLSAEALNLYQKGAAVTEGAAAVLVDHQPSDLSISQINGPFSYRTSSEKMEATQRAASTLEGETSRLDLVVDDISGFGHFDQNQAQLLDQIANQQLSPKTVLGDAFGVSAGFQTLVAIDALQSDSSAVAVLSPGGNQHAFSAILTAS